MLNQNYPRSYFLALASISINLTVVFSLIIPDFGDRSVFNFEFPEQFELNGKKALAIESQAVETKQIEPEELIKAQQKYQYFDNQRAINLEMSYLVGTRGDVGTYLREYSTISAKSIKSQEVKQLAGIGHHALFSSGDNAYLSSCISPRSPSNITQKQFSQYRYQNDLRLRVGWDWLQGKASIRDRRCLWVLLSTPITADLQAEHQALETVWQDLYQWWLPNFPCLNATQMTK